MVEHSQHLKYCTEYLDGLFWITVFGLGLILGGIALMQKLQVGSGLMVAYLVMSSAAFLVNFWLSLREVFRISNGVPKNQKIRVAWNNSAPPKSDQ